jgi:hypothetical protein
MQWAQDAAVKGRRKGCQGCPGCPGCPGCQGCPSSGVELVCSFSGEKLMSFEQGLVQQPFRRYAYRAPLVPAPTCHPLHMGTQTIFTQCPKTHDDHQRDSSMHSTSMALALLSISSRTASHAF